MLRLERDLNEQPELKEKLDAESKRIAGAGAAQSDGEIFVQAASSLGYTVTLEELERAAAEIEELDPDEMDVAGGREDEKGHDAFCFTAWHCYTAVLHTKASLRNESCWSDYTCFMIRKGFDDEIDIRDYEKQQCGKDHKKQSSWFGRED